MGKELYFAFDELMGKKYWEKNNSMKYIGKNQLKYPNQTKPMCLVRIHF
jgi:hypothetical protein